MVRGVYSALLGLIRSVYLWKLKGDNELCYNVYGYDIIIEAVVCVCVIVVVDVWLFQFSQIYTGD